MSGLLPRVRKTSDNLPAIIGAFESDTQAVIARTAPYSNHAILHGVAALVVLIIVLMCVLPLDRIATGPGQVLPTAGSFYVEPLNLAVVKSIKVHVGDVVKKGQVLATLDPTFTAADAMDYQNHLASDTAQVQRLEAEQASVPYVPKSSDHYAVVQLEDWRQRQAEYHQALADFDAKIASTASLIVKAKEDERNYEQELGIAQDVENRYTDLERQGFGAHVKTLGAVTARVETARLLAEAKNQAIQSSHDLDDLKYQRQVYMHQWQDTIATALVTARTSLNDSLDNQVKATRSRELSDIVAPQDAIVVQIGNYSPGSVADPNAQSSPGTPPLFTLVPLNGKVEAEVDVDAKDQGFVKAGDKVRIKFDAYRFIQHGTADGVVKSMSEGSFTMDRNQQPVPPYFKARVVFTNVKLRNVPSDFRLIPGMTLVGDIVIGHRTIMSYLVEGALRTGSEAMREPQ